MNHPFTICRTVAASMFLLSTSGCSTTVWVNEIDAAAAPNTVVNGIPFRVKERYRIALYELNGGKYVKVETKENFATLPNMEHVYVLNLSGTALADGTLNFKINPDNTLTNVTLTSKSKAPEFLTALGKARKDLSEADAAKAKSEATGKTAEETGLVAKEDARLAAIDAQQAAVLASIELDALSPTASAFERTTAELKVARARVLANQKARRADLALPFPNAGT